MNYTNANRLNNFSFSFHLLFRINPCNRFLSELQLRMSQLMRLWYLSHRQPAKAQATSEGSGEPAHPRSLDRAFAVRTHKVWKKTNGPTKNQTSSPIEWLRMRVWRMSLRRTIGTTISRDGSMFFFCVFFFFFFCFFQVQTMNCFSSQHHSLTGDHNEKSMPLYIYR